MIDLSNQGIRDSDINILSEFLNENNEIECIKLVKNKISDLGFAYLALIL